MIIEQKAAVVEWFDIVREAQMRSACAVDEELESYLVYLLLRFMDQPDFADQPLGMAYLTALQDSTMGRSMMLRNIGDQCLLLTGLYPDWAIHRMMRVNYYVAIGKSAYESAATDLRHEINTSQLYRRLCAEFRSLMKVLQSLRTLTPGPSPKIVQ